MQPSESNSQHQLNMNRYKDYEPLQKLVQQVDSAEAEIRRLEALKVTLTEEMQRLVASGKYEDERNVTAASTLRTKLSMIPFRQRQLGDMARSVSDDLGKPMQALRTELLDERDRLMRAAHDGLVPAVALALERFLGHEPASVDAFAEQIVARCLVVKNLRDINPLDGQGTALIAQARNMLSVGVAFDRIRAAFFTGDKLNLGAVEKRILFNLAAS